MKDATEKLYIHEKLIFYLILSLGLIVAIYPFFWMVVTSVKTDSESIENPLALPTHIFKNTIEVKIEEKLKKKSENFQFGWRISKDKPVQFKETKLPIYLKEAKDALKMGVVKIKAEIDENGNIIETGDLIFTNEGLIGRTIPKKDFKSKIAFSNTHFKALEKEVLTTFNKSKFEPATLDGKPVPVKINVTYKFTLAGIYNFKRVFHEEPYFFRFFLNSVFVAVISTILSLFLTAMAAFAFARLEFKGKEFIFTMFLATMMIPAQMLLIPNFLIVAKVLKLYDTYAALILPGLANVFNIFLLRQFFKAIPQDLFDAASIDGANTWMAFWKICIPLSKTILVTTGLFAFIFQWNSFIWPLIITTSPEIRPIQVGLSTFSSQTGADWNLLMAASFITIFPLVILYFFAQKQLIQSLARTGLKG